MDDFVGREELDRRRRAAAKAAGVRSVNSCRQTASPASIDGVCCDGGVVGAEEPAHEAGAETTDDVGDLAGDLAEEAVADLDDEAVAPLDEGRLAATRR